MKIQDCWLSTETIFFLLGIDMFAQEIKHKNQILVQTDKKCDAFQDSKFYFETRWTVHMPASF